MITTANVSMFFFISFIIVLLLVILIGCEKTRNFVKKIKCNSTKIVKTSFNLTVLFIIILLLIRLLSNNLIFKVDNFSIGGFNVILSHPDTIFKQHMKNYMNTKRTLFCIDLEKDNFSETLTSYFDTYNFIRDELKIYPSNVSSKSKIYKISEYILYRLNLFLTAYQNNYRRWYDYEISHNSKDNFNIDIGALQKQYRHYNELVCGFENINAAFRAYANAFKVDFRKWDDGYNITQ